MSDIIDEFASISVKGSFVLLMGNILALVLNAIGVILVARMLTPSEYGLFSVTLVLPGFFLIFSDIGINQALTRFIAQYRSQNRQHEINNLVKAGISFKVVLGSILTLLGIIFAKPLSHFALQRTELEGLVRIAFLFVISQSFQTTMVSILAGHERMEYAAIVNVVQSVIKGVGSPLLVFLGYGISGAVLGHVISYLLSAIAGFFLVLSIVKPVENQTGSIKMNLMMILRYSLPLIFSGILIGLSSQFRGFLLSWFIDPEVIGNYSVASFFFIMVNVVSMSIAVNLFPTFSKVNFYDSPEKGTEVYRGSVRYSSMLLLPSVTLLMTLSKPVIAVLFGDKYPWASEFLLLLILPLLFVCLGSLSNVSFLNSQGDTKASMRIDVLASIFSILLSILFIWKWNVSGLIISFIFSSLFQSLLGLYTINRLYGISPDLSHSFRTLLCCGIAGGMMYGLLSVISISPLVDILYSAFLYLFFYLLIAPFVGAIKIWDIINLNSMFKNFRVLYPFVHLFLVIEKRLIQLAEGKEYHLEL